MASDPPLLDSGNIAGPYKKGIRLVGCPLTIDWLYSRNVCRVSEAMISNLQPGK